MDVYRTRPRNANNNNGMEGDIQLPLLLKTCQFYVDQITLKPTKRPNSSDKFYQHFLRNLSFVGSPYQCLFACLILTRSTLLGYNKMQSSLVHRLVHSCTPRKAIEARTIKVDFGKCTNTQHRLPPSRRCLEMLPTDEDSSCKKRARDLQSSKLIIRRN